MKDKINKLVRLKRLSRGYLQLQVFIDGTWVSTNVEDLEVINEQGD
jgi:hypothetical protein